MWESACSARIFTAFSTASLALSDLGLNSFLQECGEAAFLFSSDFGLALSFGSGLCHGISPSPSAVSEELLGFGADASDCSKAGSCRTLPINCSAPVLPSM